MYNGVMLTEKKDHNKWIVLLGCWLLSAALQGIIDKKGMRFTLTLIYCFWIVAMIALVKFVSPWMLLIIMPAVLIVTPFSTIFPAATPRSLPLRQD